MEDDAAGYGEEQRSPAKSKQKKITFAEATAPKPTTKPTVKSAKTSFDILKHIYPHVIVEASFKLTGLAPVQDFIVNLQELLKNGQLVDKLFAFCPIDPDRTDKKIHEVSGIQPNMTILGVHFKILSNSKIPLKSRSNGEKPRRIRRCYVMSLCIFCWRWLWTKTPKISSCESSTSGSVVGGILLRVKELQSFKSDTILAFYNIFTTISTKFLLQEF